MAFKGKHFKSQEEESKKLVYKNNPVYINRQGEKFVDFFSCPQWCFDEEAGKFLIRGTEVTPYEWSNTIRNFDEFPKSRLEYQLPAIYVKIADIKKLVKVKMDTCIVHHW